MTKNSSFSIGIFSWFGFPLSVTERLKLIKEAGFEATSIWWEDEMGYAGEKKENIPSIVRDSGLILENMHAPYNNSNDLWNMNKSDREAAVYKHICWIQDCAEYDIPIIVMHITEGDVVPNLNSCGIDSILRILKEAEEFDVTIAIENTRSQDNINFLLSEIPSKNLGLCYDSSHDWLLNNNKTNLLENFGERLVATHLSDNDGIRDCHWLPGHGIIDWFMVSRLFPKSLYEGCLTLEVQPQENELRCSPKDFLDKAYKRALWSRELIESI